VEYTAEFLTPLDLRAHVPGEWVVLSLLGYQSADGERYYVPPTFITDLASIPRLVHPVLSPNGNSRRAAVLHDYRYCVKQGTREQADALFLEALEAEGVNLITRRLMWLAVRAWGWRYWNARTGITSEDFIDA
jgi:hypothetical protein